MRKIVTSLLVFGTAALFVACSSHRDLQEQTLLQGSEKLRESETVENDLRQYKIQLADVNGARAIQSYDWSGVPKAARADIKQKLLRYISLSSDVLGLGARKGFYLTHKELFVLKRDAAFAWEKSIERSEAVNGVNFDPKSSEDSKVPKPESPADRISI